MAFARSSSAQAKPPISALRCPVSINRRMIASWAFSSAVARQIARSSSSESTRSREVSSLLDRADRRVVVDQPGSHAPAERRRQFRPRPVGAHGARGARQLDQPGGDLAPGHVGRWQAVQRRPVALQIAPGLDQGARALVALGVLAQIGVDQAAHGEHVGGSDPGELALLAGVAPIAPGVDDLGGLPAGLVEIHPGDRAEGDPLALAAGRVPGHECRLAGALDAHAQAGAAGIEVEHLGLARGQGQAVEVALACGMPWHSLSLVA